MGRAIEGRRILPEAGQPDMIGQPRLSNLLFKLWLRLAGPENQQLHRVESRESRVQSQKNRALTVGIIWLMVRLLTLDP